MPNLFVSAISTWNGKALQKGSKQISAFDKSVQNLGKTFAGVFAARKVIAFGEASVKAFIADDKAARSLAKTLENLGIGYSSTNVEKFIANLQKTTGVLDDDLRPAFQSLVTATGDVALSQEALATALDISAGTGKDVKSVSAALAKSFLGQTTSLTKLGVGLSKATLKTGDMEQIMSELNKKFSGQALTAMDSYAGKMAKIEVASANVKEILGKGILDALMILGEDASIDELATDMENAATQGAKLLSTLAKITKTLSAVPVGLGTAIDWFVKKTDPFVDLIVEGDPSAILGMKAPAKKTPFAMQSPGDRKNIDKANAAAAAKAKAAADKLAREKAAELKLLKDKNNQTLLEAKMKKEQAALDELKKRYDTERLGLVAALAKATDEDTRRRIRDQIAILDGNASIAEKALDEMDKAQKDRIGLELAAAQSLAKLAAAADGVFTIFTTKVPFIGTEQGPGLKPKVDPITQAEIDAAEQDKIAFQKELEAKKAAEAAAAAKAAAEEAARNSTAGILGRIYDQRHKDDPSYFNPDYSKNTGAGVTGLGTGNTTNGNVYVDNSIHVGEGGTVVDPTTVTEIVRSAVQQNNRYGSSMQYAGNIAK